MKDKRKCYGNYVRQYFQLIILSRFFTFLHEIFYLFLTNTLFHIFWVEDVAKFLSEGDMKFLLPFKSQISTGT